MPRNNRLLLRISSVCGIVAPFITFSLILLAISQASWFSWTENALSDLGVEGVSSILFNSSLIIGGVLNSIFSFSLVQKHGKTGFGKAGAYLYLIDAIFLSLIGIFPETYGRLHFYVSVGFFVFLPVSLLLIAIHFLCLFGTRAWGFFTILISVITIIPWSLTWSGVAIPEIISASAGAVWSVMQAYTILRATSEKT